MPSIYDAIISDHNVHRAMLNILADTTGDSEKRRQTWKDFYNEVKAHAAAEEETFYSTLMAETWGQDAARHSVHEHAQLDEIMDELNEMDMSSPGWLLRFKTLKDEYEHHMEEEENEVFERAKKVVDKKDDNAFGRKFLDRKKEELTLVDEKLEDSLED